MPSPKKDEEEEGENKSSPSALPFPPKPPRAKIAYKELGYASRSIDNLKRSLELLSLGETLSPIHSFRTPYIPSPPDPNSFYYKHNRPNTPRHFIELECKQWRHATDYECFSSEIHFDLDDNQEKIDGSIECKVYAENLSQCETKVLPISITIKPASTYQKALELIQYYRQSSVV